MVKNKGETVDATPSKRLYLSIIADYTVERALCELIDNAVDLSCKPDGQDNLTVSIDLNLDQQLIRITDNAGGVPHARLRDIVAPGSTGNTGVDETIGIFGVGSKRATIALAQEVRIRTREAAADTFELSLNDEWIEEADNWDVSVRKAPNIDEGTTVIELVKLRTPLTIGEIDEVRQYVSATYGKIFLSSKLAIVINGESVSATTFEDWAYPPEFEPRRYLGTVSTASGDEISVEAIAGLSKTSSPASGDYGVYFYCNNRLIARALKSIDVGFTTGLAGKPHPDASLMRVIVSLSGPARLMPWNSSKSDIHAGHEVFAAIRLWLVQVVKDFASLSRRLNKSEGGWHGNVFAYRTGEIVTIPMDDLPNARTSFLPPLPTAKPRFDTKVTALNKTLAKNKPWVMGLYEAIIAVDIIDKKNFSQGNRINLILLDSTLEIGFKEFLVNDVQSRYGEKRIQDIFSNRVDVHNEIKKHKRIAKADWKRIEYFYNLRCYLIHRKATASIDDNEILEFRLLVQKVLGKLFQVKFD